jgi:hypothetical protein
MHMQAVMRAAFSFSSRPRRTPGDRHGTAGDHGRPCRSIVLGRFPSIQCRNPCFIYLYTTTSYIPLAPHACSDQLVHQSRQ